MQHIYTYILWRVFGCICKHTASVSVILKVRFHGRRRRSFESRYGRNHFLGRPCFGTNFVLTFVSEREKYCAALSQIACHVKFTRRVHPDGFKPGIPSLWRNQVAFVQNLKYRPFVPVEEPARRRRYRCEFTLLTRMFRSLFHPRNCSEHVSRTCESCS